MTLDNTTVTGNKVDSSPGSGYGGGLAFVGGNAAKLVVENGMVDSNSANGLSSGQGGGLYAAGGTVTLTNETINSNTAQGNLGGFGSNSGGHGQPGRRRPRRRALCGGQHGCPDQRLR